MNGPDLDGMVWGLVIVGMIITMMVLGVGYVAIYFLNISYTNLLEAVVIIMFITIVYMFNRK